MRFRVKCELENGKYLFDRLFFAKDEHDCQRVGHDFYEKLINEIKPSFEQIMSIRNYKLIINQE